MTNDFQIEDGSFVMTLQMIFFGLVPPTTRDTIPHNALIRIKLMGDSYPQSRTSALSGDSFCTA
jgi:hypothetical protein